LNVDLIDYYTKNELVIGLYIDELEKIDALGKLPPPLIENTKNTKKFNL